jgi:hypothetical protein
VARTDEAAADGGEPDDPPAKPARAAKTFRPPTLAEVAAYCRERGNRIDPQAFLDHYESNGWKVGRNPMKCWQAAVRTWEKNGIANGQPANRPGRVHDGTQRKLNVIRE